MLSSHLRENCEGQIFFSTIQLSLKASAFLVSIQFLLQNVEAIV